MSDPTVSIGMPVRNAARYLEEALDSLLGQTFGDFELVISDNRSSDRTETICRAYATRDRRIRYVRQSENHGAMWNFNQVFDLSRGRFFKWAAHDDVCAPTFLARCVEVLEQNPAIVCCHTGTTKIDQHGRIIALGADLATGQGTPATGARPVAAGRGFARRLDRPDLRFRDVLMSDAWTARTYGVIRRAVLRQCRPILPCYGAEKVLMAELLLRGAYHEVSDRLFFERIHPAASGNLRSAADEQRFFAPGQPRRITPPRVRLLAGYVQAVGRVNLGLRDRVWCALWITGYLFQVRKWKRVVTGAWRGTGLGGGYSELLAALVREGRAGHSLLADRRAGEAGPPLEADPSIRPEVPQWKAG